MLISHLRHYYSRISDHFIDTSLVLQTKQKICYLFSHKVSLSFMDFFILSLQILLLHTQKVMTFTLHLFNIQYLREMQSWRGNIDECSILRGQERPQGKFQIILLKVISIWFKKIICDDCISQRPIWVTFILFIIYFSFVFAMIEFKLRITLH